jgi:hypothetical protein
MSALAYANVQQRRAGKGADHEDDRTAASGERRAHRILVSVAWAKSLGAVPRSEQSVGDFAHPTALAPHCACEKLFRT